MDRRAQAEDRAQGEQLGESRAEGIQRQVDEVARLEERRRFVEAAGDRQAEAGDRLARIKASGGVAFVPVHHDAPAGVGERQRREQEPRQAAALAGVTRPVEVGADRRLGQRRAGGAHESGDLVAGLLLDPEQHQEDADLLGPRAAGEDHRHRFLGLGQRQGARQRLAAAENSDELRQGCGSVVKEVNCVSRRRTPAAKLPECARAGKGAGRSPPRRRRPSRKAE